jgi:hypothetical protein
MSSESPSGGLAAGVLSRNCCTGIAAASQQISCKSFPLHPSVASATSCRGGASPARAGRFCKLRKPDDQPHPGLPQRLPTGRLSSTTSCSGGASPARAGRFCTERKPGYQLLRNVVRRHTSICRILTSRKTREKGQSPQFKKTTGTEKLSVSLMSPNVTSKHSR